MKRAAIALRALLRRAAASVGAEGTFLGVGTIGLAYVANYIHPVGAAAVVSVMCLVVGVALAVPSRNTPGPQ